MTSESSGAKFLSVAAFNLCLAVLPLTVAGQAKNGSTGARNVELERVLREYLKEQDVDTPTRYAPAFVDLNDDGKQEVIVHVMSQRLCGTGGCPTLILAATPSSYRIITRVTITWPPIRVLPTKTKGWHDIAVWVQGGGIQPGYEAELRYDGDSYPSNPTVYPARRLTKRSAGKIVIPENATGNPLN